MKRKIIYLLSIFIDSTLYNGYKLDGTIRDLIYHDNNSIHELIYRRKKYYL